jgi:hypothetical protein
VGLDLLEDRRWGKNLDTTGFMAGREAQIMPTFTSIFDHTAISTLCPTPTCVSNIIAEGRRGGLQGRSLPATLTHIALSLKILTKQATPPKAKTSINPIFCLIGSVKVERTGIGNPIVTKSVKILKEALKNIINFLLRQIPLLVQNAEIGVQQKIDVKRVEMPYIVMIPIATKEA